MNRKVIVFFVLVCSFILFQQCSTIRASNNHKQQNTTTKENPIIVAKSDSLQLYKDSVVYYKGLLKKVKEKSDINPPKRDTLLLEGKVIIDSAQVNLYKDSLQVEKAKNKLLKDSLGFEKAKLLDAYLKSDTLILKTKEEFEAKILSLQKPLEPKILYKLVPYTIVKKDLMSVVVTALSVFLVMISIFLLAWKKYVPISISKIEVPKKDHKVLQELKDEEFSK